MVQISFNASGVKPQAALDVLPSGVYDVIITRTEEKPTKDQRGSYIEFEMTTQGGEYSGRKIFDRLNIKNQSQQAVDIAYGTLSAICHVTGMINIQDTQQLHGIPFKVVLAKQPRGDTPEGARPEDIRYTNEVKGYKDRAGNDPGQGGAGAGGGGQGNQGGGGGAPWQNGGGGQGAAQNNQGGQAQQPNNGSGNQGGYSQGGNGGQQNGTGQGGQAPPWQGGGQNNGGQNNGQGNQGNGGGQVSQGNQGNQGGPGNNPPWAQGNQGGGQ